MTVEHVDLKKFMGDWYVLAGRFTLFESGVHNGLESYTWNETKQRIDVAFTYHQGSFDGPMKSIPQKAWVHDQSTNSHWKISPLWPIKLDYLIVALDPSYQWCAIGVPDQKYLWIMARDWRKPQHTIDQAKAQLQIRGYPTTNLSFVPHQW